MTKSANLNRYNFLSIGQRGVGKTVFLASCYLECHQDKAQQRLLWFDCENPEVRQLIDHILSYVAKTGDYPPATLKVTNFGFDLKQRHQRGSKTVGRVQWWDTPGEMCDSLNASLKTLLANADGCCLFLEAPALVKASDSPLALMKLLRPLEAVIELLHQDGIDLPLAVIVTKCDYLSPHPLQWQCLKKALTPLFQKLKAQQAPYQVFYSEIPITVIDGIPTLQLIRVGTPIYWLFAEIHKRRSPDYDPQLAPSEYYIPTPPPKVLTPFLGNRHNFHQLNQIPKRQLLLGLMSLMGLITLGLALILQYSFKPEAPIPPKPSPPLLNN
ncbi:MAG: hypothetical protein VKJ02_01005 [Snowella sp.]|nr:hypothetical protein [Snowella sp.]